MDVAVIGAGPAGLMAAEVLAQGGAHVTVFDAIADMGKARALQGAFEQTQKYVAQAAARLGIKL